MRFLVLTATNMKKGVFWDAAPCIRAIVQIMETVSTSETSDNSTDHRA
jgi:hypothetical protein